MSEKKKVHRAPSPHPILSKENLSIIIDTFLRKAKKPLIAIVGPTASGKTSLSIQIAKKWKGEIINADSRQFYKGMDIGTAKILPEEKQEVPHFLLDFLNPDEQCPVAVFKKLADKKIEEIHKRNHIPMLVGGTGLFVDAIRHNFCIPKIPPQPEWRKQKEGHTSEQLYKELTEKDPHAAKCIDKKNRIRILRALEVYDVSGGNKISDLQKKGEKKWDTLLIGVWQDPDALALAIKKRTENIWQSGFLQETQSLLEKGYTEETPAMIAHGYREAMQFLKGTLPEEEAKYQMMRNTRRYAKRQRTWWRREKKMYWVNPTI